MDKKMQELKAKPGNQGNFQKDLKMGDMSTIISKIWNEMDVSEKEIWREKADDLKKQTEERIKTPENPKDSTPEKPEKKSKDREKSHKKNKKSNLYSEPKQQEIELSDTESEEDKPKKKHKA